MISDKQEHSLNVLLLLLKLAGLMRFFVGPGGACPSTSTAPSQRNDRVSQIQI